MTKQRTAQQFSERLNTYLNDEMDAPNNFQKRVQILSGLLKEPPYTVRTYLEGNYLPDAKKIAEIAEQLEVEAAWLTGEEALLQKSHENGAKKILS